MQKRTRLANIVALFSLAVLGISYQNCGDVSVNPIENKPLSSVCSDFSASRPESIYADASLNPDTVIFRMHERDNNNFLMTSARSFRWSMKNGGSVVSVGNGSEIEILLDGISACAVVEIGASLSACGKEYNWKLNYTRQNPSGTCQPTPTSSSSTSTTVTTVTTLPAHQQTGAPPPPSCQSTSDSGVCAPATSGPLQPGGSIEAIMGAGQIGAYIPPETTWVIPMRTGAVEGRNYSLTVFNGSGGSANICVCKYSISKTPGDLRDVLMGPNFRAHGGGDFQCMGLSGADPNGGILIGVVETNQASAYSPHCPLSLNSNYYLNINCGPRTTDPDETSTLPGRFEYPWMPFTLCLDPTNPMCSCAIQSRSSI